jgi:ATP-dependent DNA ligase
MMRKKPMLAYPVSDKPIDYTQPVFMQPKLDGVRCLIQYEIPFGSGHMPNSGKVVAYSRTGKEWKNIDHILQGLKPFFDANPGVILDGELYNHALKDDFEKIISCVRKTKPTAMDRAESRKLVQFHCYDIVDESMTFDKRYKFVFDNLRDSYGVRTVATQAVATESLSKVIHQQNLDNGYEGSILRLNDVYQCKRSRSLCKFKDFHDAEAVIVDWVEGKGKRKGTIGKFMAIDADGNKFGMPVMDNFKKLQTMFKEMQSWVGKEATFTYFERTKANSYRHPLFKAIRDYE